MTCGLAKKLNSAAVVIIDTPPHMPHLRIARKPVPSISPCCMAQGASTT